jgi:hypothetical protein
MKQVASRFHSGDDMQTPINDSRLLMIWTAVVALTLFCATVIAALSGWIPNALGHTGNSGPPVSRAWWGSNTTHPLAARVHPAFFTAPADHTQVNATLKTTKG